MRNEFYPLKVVAVRAEIEGKACSFMLKVPPELRSTFSWEPGQHITLRLNLNGSEVRRCYSISSQAGRPLRFTVKGVQNGLVSNFLCDNIQAGAALNVSPPFGSFVLTPDPRARRTYYFIGAGSGITPLFR